MIKDKVKNLAELKRITSDCRKRGEKIVFTNGCFDILHLGHIRCLEMAASYGEKLVVAVNSDSSVKKIKGNSRPIFTEEERAFLVAACECVDYVTIFSQTTPLRLIKALKPAVLVKGGDWHKNNIVGADFVRTYGGKVVKANFIKGYSSSSIINKLLKAFKDN